MPILHFSVAQNYVTLRNAFHRSRVSVGSSFRYFRYFAYYIELDVLEKLAIGTRSERDASTDGTHGRQTVNNRHVLGFNITEH
jgi:hypothetical protein